MPSSPLRPDDLRRVGRCRPSSRIADSLTTSSADVPVHASGRDPVAVTLLARTAAPDSASRDRFTAEGTVARRVAPFCAARILDAGFDNGLPFLVSEFIEGPSLAETITVEGPLEGPVLAALAIGAATGLTSIHQAGLVHGDFGPDHVVLGTEVPRVVHFSTTPPYGPATPSADLLAWAQTPPRAPGCRQPARGVAGPCPPACSRPGQPPTRTLVTALLGHNDPRPGCCRRHPAGPRGRARSARTRPVRRSPPVQVRRVAWAGPAWPVSPSSWWRPS